MADDPLIEMLDLGESCARSILISTEEELVPMFDLRNAKNRAYLVMAPFSGETREEVTENKDRVAKVIRKLIRKNKIVRYSFLSEVWMIVRRGVPYREGISTPPSDSVDRIEAVLIVACDGDNQQSRTLLIKRDGAKCIDLVRNDPAAGEPVVTEGRFGNLFKAVETADSR